MRKKAAAQPLWRVDAQVPNAAEGQAVELFSAHFGSSVTSYSDLETGRATISVYLADGEFWKEALPPLRETWVTSVDLPFPRCKLSRVRRQDWAESWKRHFKPMCVARRLWVRPSWRPVQLKPGQQEIVLDPGLSFGTGQHPTTAFCLQETVRRREQGRRQAYLDVGTGSGILAIAAVKIGFGPVEAFDLDPEAVRVARKNARMNNVGRKIRFTERDVADLALDRRSYSVVCANLISNVILNNLDVMLARVEPGGTFITAGILATEFARVRKALAAEGWTLLRTRAQKEWQSGSFRKTISQ